GGGEDARLVRGAVPRHAHEQDGLAGEHRCVLSHWNERGGQGHWTGVEADVVLVVRWAELVAGTAVVIAGLHVHTHVVGLTRRDDDLAVVGLIPGRAHGQVADSGRQIELIAAHRLTVDGDASVLRQVLQHELARRAGRRGRWLHRPR